MDGAFELPATYVAIRDEARALAEAIAPLAAEADASGTIHAGIRSALAESGLVALTVPAVHGGRYDVVDPLAIAVVREAFAGVSAHLDSLFAMQGIGSFALGQAGSEELRTRWLPAVGTLRAIPALALTEPNVGSDLREIETTVRERSGELVLSGRKSFITNAGEADIYSVLAREGDGFSLIAVPADTPGLSTAQPHQIIAPHVLGDVMLDGAPVPVENRIGASGTGFPLVMATLATFRVSVAGAALGLAAAALGEAVRHVDGRSSFGVPMARLGSIPQELARSWTEIEMARALTYRAAAAAGRDPLGSITLSSMAKVGATEAAGRVVDRAVQMMGRHGLTRGTVIERLYREARPMRIYEGATEVLHDALARALVKEHQR